MGALLAITNFVIGDYNLFCDENYPLKVVFNDYFSYVYKLLK